MPKSVNSLQLTFSNKVVIVTGAAHGIGRSICNEFSVRGASVIATDILEDELIKTEHIVNLRIKDSESSGSVNVYNCDVTSPDEVQRMVDKVIKDYGKVDILVNVAGGVAGQVHQSIENVTDDEWRKIMELNLDSVFYMTRAVAANMKENEYGRIVNISSGAGRSSSLTGIQAYTSAKAGQIGFTRQMAKELGPHGITVNNVAPGFVLSNPSSQKQWKTLTDQEQARLIDSIALKRLGNPEDIAYPVLFFASDFASYVSGQVISVDGGLQTF